MCYFNNYHLHHKVIEISEIKSLENENISLEEEKSEFNKSSLRVMDLKNKIEAEIKKTNDLFKKTDEDLTKIFSKKHEKLLEEEEKIKEKLRIETTKALEPLENILIKVNDVIRLNERINKGINKIEKEDKNLIKILSYISKMNKTKKEMEKLFSQLLRNIKYSFENENNNIKYEEYYFNGLFIPSIEINDITYSSANISWNIDNNMNILNIDKNYLQIIIEIRKEKEQFERVYEKIYYFMDSKSNYCIKNLENNTTYEIRVCSLYNYNYHPITKGWSPIKKFKTLDYSESIILKESNKEKEFYEKLKEWIGFRKIELLFRGTREGNINKNFYTKCSKQGPTITLVKNEKGNIFGGYASKDWNNENKKIYQFSAPESFLFTLSNIYNSEPIKFPSNATGADIRNYGVPAFGWGPDLGICGDLTNQTGTGWSWFPSSSFNDILGKERTVFTGDIDKNNIYFKVKEIEVFKVIK